MGRRENERIIRFPKESHEGEERVSFTFLLREPIAASMIGEGGAFFFAIAGVENEVIGLKGGYRFSAILALLCSACCVILYVTLRKRDEVI
jgi:hypothetical protein